MQCRVSLKPSSAVANTVNPQISAPLTFPFFLSRRALRQQRVKTWTAQMLICPWFGKNKLLNLYVNLFIIFKFIYYIIIKFAIVIFFCKFGDLRNAFSELRNLVWFLLLIEILSKKTKTSKNWTRRFIILNHGQNHIFFLQKKISIIS